MKIKIAELGNHLFTTAPGLYRHLYSAYKAVSDRKERQLISSIVGEGMTVIDVGANIGAYTGFFAKLVGPGGRVIAIEPEQENFKRLVRATSDYPWVESRCAAASDQTGECILYKSASLNVDHQTYDSGEARQKITIPAICLDDLVPAGSSVDFIKMDIQGAETAAIRGARRILEENPGIALLFEYWPYAIRRSGHDPAELLDSLRQSGFRLHMLNDDSRAQHNEGKDDYCNVIASRAAIHVS